jgi:hypothetical protein
MSKRSCVARKLDVEAVKKARKVGPKLYAKYLAKKRAQSLRHEALRKYGPDVLEELRALGGKTF